MVPKANCDVVVAPFDAEEMELAILEGKEWFIHEKREDSPQTRFGIFLFDHAAADFRGARLNEPVRRSVFTLADARRCATATGTSFGENTTKGVPKTLAASLESFDHYYDVGKRWFHFKFRGPGPEHRRADATRSRHGNYYLSVCYEPIPANAVPMDRRNHRPGHLQPPRTVEGRLRSSTPAVVPDFCGRGAEIRQLLRRFANRKGLATAVSIQGMPGVGKTEVVAALAERLKNLYSDGHVYLSAMTDTVPLSASSILRHAINRLADGGSMEIDGSDDLAAKYRALLRDRRLLIICENVTTVEQVESLLPVEGNALVVTSRRFIQLPGYPSPFQLGPLTSEMAARFLCEAVGAFKTPAPVDLTLAARSAVRWEQPAREIVTVADVVALLCGNLPLALRICAQYVKQNIDVEAGAFAKTLLWEHERLALTGGASDSRSVEASVNISYHHLNPKAQRAFRLLGVFPATFSRSSAWAVLSDCAAADTKPVSELVQHGLVTFDVEARQYRLHELLRAYAGALLSREERDKAIKALDHFYKFYGVFLGADREQWHLPDQFVITLNDLVADFPTIADAIERDLEDGSWQRLIDCGGKLDPLAPALLKLHPRFVYDWANRLSRALAPIATEHLILASDHARSWPVPHYHRMLLFAALAVEQTFPWETAGARAYELYCALWLSAKLYGMQKEIRREIYIGLDRIVRICRRYGLYDDIPKFIETIEQECDLRSPIARALSNLVLAEYHERINDRAAAVTAVQRALTIWENDNVPWPDLFCFDAVASVPWCYLEAVRGEPAVKFDRLQSSPLWAAVREEHHRMNMALVALPLEAGSALFDAAPAEAVRFYDAALAIGEALGDERIVTTVLMARAHIHGELGDNERCESDTQRVLPLIARGAGLPQSMKRLLRTEFEIRSKNSSDGSK